MASAGLWYVWTGTHWEANEPSARQKSFNLSAIILEEVEDFEKKQLEAASDSEKARYAGITKSLKDWAKKSEMAAKFADALKITKDLVTQPAAEMNKDPYLLNVQNGTVDLRTGELREHRRGDLINCIIPLEYDPNATAPLFSRFIKEITGEADCADNKAPLAGFLQRWFGYSVTGSTREQKFAVHWGDGGNGKSTLLEAVSGAVGPYASTAAPHLLVAGGESRHPAEIADLWGRRMVTAHKFGEDGRLREEFVKAVTGGDKMKGRFMDFFQFRPTHKLQLCTNYKPGVKGTDFGIWRRVLLIPYTVKCGSQKEAADGRATIVKDEKLEQKLAKERVGILAWVIGGAWCWYQAGLAPPEVVLAAGEAYKSEQDRVMQFIHEECIVDAGAWTPLNAPGGRGTRVGLYPEYCRWCKDSGYQALGKGRLQSAIEQKVPAGRWETKYIPLASHPLLLARVSESPNKRRKVVGFSGLKLISNDDTDSDDTDSDETTALCSITCMTALVIALVI